MSEPKTKIVHFRVPADLFDWSMGFAQAHGWTCAQYMRLLMEAQREQSWLPGSERPASNLLLIASEPKIRRALELAKSPAVEPNGH